MSSSFPRAALVLWHRMLILIQLPTSYTSLDLFAKSFLKAYGYYYPAVSYTSTPKYFYRTRNNNHSSDPEQYKCCIPLTDQCSCIITMINMFVFRRLLQAYSAKREAVHLCERREGLRNRQAAAQAMPLLPLPQVFARRHARRR